MRRFLQAALIGVLLSACGTSASVTPTPAPTPAVGGNEAHPPASSPIDKKTELAATGPLRAGQIEFAMIDVGQGDGLVLRTSAGVTIVVDTGTGSGGKAIAGYLAQQRIASIDLLILTHPHADHIGGVTHILQSTKVSAAWVSGYAGQTRTQARVLEEFEQRGVPTTAVRRGNQAILDGGVELNVLAPQDPLLQNSRSDANANSVVLWIKHGEVDFLLTGDAEAETETRVLEALRGRPPPDFEVLKVAHHGSRYASSDTFLKRVKPQVALISCGRNNRYKHPHPDTLGRLEHRGAQIFRTDLHGTIRLRSDGENILVILDKQTRQGKNSRFQAAQLGKNGAMTLHLASPRADLGSGSQEFGIVPGSLFTRGAANLRLSTRRKGNGVNFSHGTVRAPENHEKGSALHLHRPL